MKSVSAVTEIDYLPKKVKSVRAVEPRLISQVKQGEGTQKPTPFALPEIHSETL